MPHVLSYFKRGNAMDDLHWGEAIIALILSSVIVFAMSYINIIDIEHGSNIWLAAPFLTAFGALKTGSW
jgi:hypothetical protein